MKALNYRNLHLAGKIITEFKPNAVLELAEGIQGTPTKEWLKAMKGIIYQGIAAQVNG